MSALLSPQELASHGYTVGSLSANSRQGEAVTGAEIVHWHELGETERERWRVLRSDRPEFTTPFFSLEFIDAVHQARGDVRVIMLSGRDRLLGMLPIHQVGRTAFPAGRFFNDAHNAITAADTHVDWLKMLASCKLRSYDFHAMVGQSDGFSPTWVDGSTQSFSASLGDDSLVFLKSLEREHSTIRKQDQKTRKMGREVGEVTLEMDCRDPLLLAQAIEWKREQYRRTNILDLFTPQWTRNMASVLHSQPADEPMASCKMRGLLSVLRAGDEVVAMHYGMVENGLLHYWFPSYLPKFAQYSPGTALFKAIVRDSSAHGIRCIDMGYGEQPYKRKQTDTITTVSHGSVTGSLTYRLCRAARKKVVGAMKSVPMKDRLKRVLRTVQPNAGIGKIG